MSRAILGAIGYRRHLCWAADKTWETWGTHIPLESMWAPSGNPHGIIAPQVLQDICKLRMPQSFSEQMQRLLISVCTCGTGVGAPSTFLSWVSLPVTCLVLPLAFLGPLHELVYLTKTAANVSGEGRGGSLLFYLIKLVQHRSRISSREGGSSGLWERDKEEGWRPPLLAAEVHYSIFLQLNQHLLCVPLESFGTLFTRPAGCFQAPSQQLSPRFDVGGYLASPSAKYDPCGAMHPTLQCWLSHAAFEDII